MTKHEIEQALKKAEDRLDDLLKAESDAFGKFQVARIAVDKCRGDITVLRKQLEQAQS